jgi:hypothetical protein
MHKRYLTFTLIIMLSGCSEEEILPEKEEVALKDVFKEILMMSYNPKYYSIENRTSYKFYEADFYRDLNSKFELFGPETVNPETYQINLQGSLRKNKEPQKTQKELLDSFKISLTN